VSRMSLYHAWLQKTIAYLDADYVSLEADTVLDNGEPSEVSITLMRSEDGGVLQRSQVSSVLLR
jgi:hypothetical protein